MSKERVSEQKEGKRQRIGFGANRTRLQLSDEDLEKMTEEGYRPYWFNDEYGAVNRAKAAGYVHVNYDEVPSLGDGEIHQGSTDLSKSQVSKIVSRNPEMRAFLMKTKLEHYEEDQLARRAENAKVEQALKAGGSGGASIENQYGNVELTRS